MKEYWNKPQKNIDSLVAVASVVIATAPGVVFVDNIIVLIGSTYLAFDDINTATKTKAAAVLVHANIDTASHTVSNTGTLKTKLTGATTSV